MRLEGKVALISGPAKIYGQSAYLSVLINSDGVGGNVQPGDAQRAGGVDDLDQLVQDNVGHLVLLTASGGRSRGAGLIPHRV
jgi:hypothetical protein